MLWLVFFYWDKEQRVFFFPSIFFLPKDVFLLKDEERRNQAAEGLIKNVISGGIHCIFSQNKIHSYKTEENFLYFLSIVFGYSNIKYGFIIKS